MKRLFGILLWALFCLFGTQLSFGQNNREQVLALQRQAIELMDNGDPDQGIVLLRQALTLDPDYWPLTYEMAYAYMVKRDYQKAIKLAKTLYKYEDCNDLVYQLVGNCYDYLKNPKKALKVYAQGLKRFPDSGAHYLEQGGVSGMQGHYDEAVASFEKGISVAPMFPSNYYRAAQFYAYSTSKVWSQIYGEITKKLLPSGDRNKEMSELLFRNYITGIVFSTDSVAVDFYENRPIAITIDMLLAGDVREPYGAVYEAAMQAAALSGVDVRLMLPERADNRITHLGSRSYLADVLRAGVKVFFYKKGFLHSKLMVSDDMLSTVGSTNVDFRSFEHNFEVNAFMYDMVTALQMKEIFMLDQRECTQVFLKYWIKRPWPQIAMESVVRLLAPLL